MPNQQQQSKKSSGFSLPPGTGTLINVLIPESFKASLPSFFTTSPFNGVGGAVSGWGAGLTAATAVPVLAPVALAFALGLSSRKPPRQLTDLGQMPDVSKLSKVKAVSKKADTGVGGSNVDIYGNPILKTGYANLSATLDDDSVVDISNADKDYLDIYSDQIVDRYYNKDTGQLVSVPRSEAFKGGAKDKVYGRTILAFASGGAGHSPQGGGTAVGAYYKENQEKSPEEKAAEQARAMMKSGVRSVSGSVSGGAMVANNPAPSQFKIFLDNFKKQQQSGAA